MSQACGFCGLLRYFRGGRDVGGAIYDPVQLKDAYQGTNPELTGI